MKQKKSKFFLTSAALTLAAGGLCLFLAAGCGKEQKSSGSGVVFYHTPAGNATPGNSTAASADRSASPITESTVSASTQTSEVTPVPTQTPTPTPTPRRLLRKVLLRESKLRFPLILRNQPMRKPSTAESRSSRSDLRSAIPITSAVFLHSASATGLGRTPRRSRSDSSSIMRKWAGAR